MTQRKTASAPSSVVARFPSAAKLFVLDTNVLMHDPTSLFRFEEHDLYIPMATLEELDHNKQGVSEVARNARQASRFLDEMIGRWDEAIAAGIALAIHGDKTATGRLFLQTESINGDIPAGLAAGKSDNQVLAVVKHLQERHPQRQVILVTKDINMRIKARALGLAAEDYFNGRCSRIPTSSTPAPASCRGISGSLTAATWSRGSSPDKPTTACTAPCAASCS
jgi:PhoH-like ATPase